jgi:hypothetical protein
MLSAIVAICLISIGFGLATRAVISMIGATHRLLDSARSLATMCRLDDMAVMGAGRIRQPVWLGAPEFTAGSGTISVAYLDGDPESELSLRWDDDVVSITVGLESQVIRGLSITDARVAARWPAYLEITCEAENAAVATITAPFGLFPVPRP